MTEQLSDRRDRALGFALMLIGLAVSVIPDFLLGGQPIDPSLVGSAWMVAGVLLATSALSARPMPARTRQIAAFLFVFGLASPFLINLINSSSGA